ncbi:MAG TPA: hypothetical protein VMW41_01235 [Candidatus Bathyarchaeia archaeon]|nr:hypothetical protein [Candidatus Bathyarchaeia archaeon]
MNLKKNWYLAALICLTLVLGVAAVVTAWKLYQVGKRPVAPTQPESQPGAVAPECILEFDIPTPTPTPTPTPPVSQTPTPTPTPIPECWDTCDSDSDCPDTLVCQKPSANDTSKRCVSSDCPREEDCVCPSPTPTPTSTQTPTPTGQPSSTPTPTPGPTSTPKPTLSPTPTSISELPKAGGAIETSVFIVAGLFILLFGLLLPI